MAQTQLAGASTVRICCPTVDCVETAWPDAPVSAMAGSPVGALPDGLTEIWNEGPVGGGDEHWNAQPMFHGAAEIANTGLVQLPWD
jgi:hypothetical protein